MIIFSKEACALLGLKKEETLSLAQDDVHPEKWYFYKDPDGFPLKENKGGPLWICHRQLVTTYLECFDLDLTKTHKTTFVREPVLMSGKRSGTQYWLMERIVVKTESKSKI